MGRPLLIGLALAAVAAGAAALAWNTYPPAPEAVVGVTEVDAPAARSIFPKVLNQ